MAPPGLFRFEIGIETINDMANLAVSRRRDNARLFKTVRALVAGVPRDGPSRPHRRAAGGGPRVLRPHVRRGVRTIRPGTAARLFEDAPGNAVRATPRCSDMNTIRIRRTRYIEAPYCRMPTSTASRRSKTSSNTSGTAAS
ncbi:MAG: hypothetical protein MZU95_08045 [Desulfomicrobium escambiense]|nr:hypothetical protein [Desulfomicrobium escambiense]